VRLARSAAAAAGVGDLVSLQQGDCSTWRPKRTPTVVATNPPWGTRLLGGEDDRRPQQQQQQQEQQEQQQQQQRHQERGSPRDGFRGGGGGAARADMGAEPPSAELFETWGRLSGFLKERCPGADAWVLSGAPDLTAALGMRSFKKRAVTVGGVKAAWLGYQVRGLDER
jgi:23S rRNA G2445 N2-methylase RlmL